MTGAKCEICGEPMPSGEQMFRYHGYSGNCPKPPLAKVNETPASLTSGQGKVTDEMVYRFLAWKLPDDFSPDAGISFDPVFNKGTPYEMRHQPVGTNLLNFEQARVMLEHVLAVADQLAGGGK